MKLDSHNPDVLLCLANLSSDEVFTPPRLANDLLDLLPAKLWSDPKATFLDPVCKSGVFLRDPRGRHFGHGHERHVGNDFGEAVGERAVGECR